MSTDAAETPAPTGEKREEQSGGMNGKARHDSSSRKERPMKRGGGGRFEPYVNKRYRIFVSNIPYDVKWQVLKDLIKEQGEWSG